MKLSAAIDDFLIAAAADGLSEKTIKWYRSLMKPLDGYFKGHEMELISTRQLREYIVYLRQTCQTPDTLNAHLRALHRVWKWCSHEYRIPNPMGNIRYPRQPQQQDPKAVHLEDVRRMFQAAGDPDWLGRGEHAAIRDVAILAFSLDTGCRAGGTISLLMDNLDMARRSAIVWEKGKKRRKVVFTSITAILLQKWLNVRSERVATVFYSLTSREPLTVSGLYQLFKRIAQRAGIEAKWNPHAFRHTFAREYLRNGGDLATLSQLMGHADLSTTASFYSIFTQDELAEQHERFSPTKMLFKNQKTVK